MIRAMHALFTCVIYLGLISLCILIICREVDKHNKDK